MRREAADAEENERRRSPWYRDGVYVNLDDEPAVPLRAVPLLPFLKWRLRRLARREPAVIPGAGDNPCLVRPLEPGALAPPAAGIKVAWLGHASLYVVAPGLRLAIDPLFGALPLVPRLCPPPILPEDLPPPDVLLLTHNHFDHLHPPSIAAIRARAPGLRALVPSGLGGYVRRRLGIAATRVVEWWESVEEAAGVKITFVPARHWSKRALGDTRQSHWAGFVIEAGGRRLFVAGDTAMGKHFSEIAARFPEGFDAAVMPIGAYSPRWFMHDRHMDPPEAVAAARTLRARLLLPIHWGTFKLTDEPLGEPPVYAEREAAAAGQPIRVWLPGDVVQL